MSRAFAALALVLALVVWRYAPPPARGEDTPPGDFSAVRAKATLARVLGDGRPHPVGSAANAAVRAALVRELASLGLQAESEERFLCRGPRCATVTNLVARVRGRNAGQPAVLLACHYDSVAAGPGASDDGSGVATTLEVARALIASKPLSRDVWLLLDDGEEANLMGAEAFVRDADRLQGVAAIVNVEARGTSGPSLLFELSPGNERLVEAAARSLPRPVTNSIYYTLYQRLPNDTDLTVFKGRGLAGVNFAFVGGPLRYHTPRDDLAHLDPRSLQHHGDHVLAIVRALANAGGSWHSTSDAVFFDVLSLFVVRWPERWTLPLAVLGAVLVVAAVLLARRRVRRGSSSGAEGGAGWGGLAALATVVLGGGLGWALTALLRALGGLPYDWSAHSWPFRLAFWSLAAATVATVSWLLGDRLRPAGAWAATWIGWALLAVVTAALVPGVSYPLVVPVLVAGLAAVAVEALGRPGWGAWGTLPPLIAAALLIFPMGWMLYEGMGRAALPGVSTVVALVLSGALPVFAGATRRERGGVAAVAGITLLVGAVAARALTPFTQDGPQPLSLVLHYDADRKESHWVVGGAGPDLPLPPALARKGRFAVAAPYPWSPDVQAWVGAGPSLRLAPPELLVESVAGAPEGFRVRGRLRSARGAPIAGIFAEAATWRGARVGGQDVELPKGAGADSGYLNIEHVTLPADGVPIELLFRGPPVTLYVYDIERGVEWAGAELLRLRPRSAVPIGRGDRSVVSRRLQLDLGGPH